MEASLAVLLVGSADCLSTASSGCERRMSLDTSNLLTFWIIHRRPAFHRQRSPVRDRVLDRWRASGVVSARWTAVTPLAGTRGARLYVKSTRSAPVRSAPRPTHYIATRPIPHTRHPLQRGRVSGRATSRAP